MASDGFDRGVARGVSPVLGVLLMLAVTLTLTLLIATVVVVSGV